MIEITDTITIQDWELSETFTRASGPGGQNVNKVSTSVELRFEAARCPALTQAVKTRLRRIAGRKWTKDGAILIVAEKHRSQAMNRALAEEKLQQLILEALIEPKRRIKTRPTMASKKRRLQAKSHRAGLKVTRGPVADE